MQELAEACKAGDAVSVARIIQQGGAMLDGAFATTLDESILMTPLMICAWNADDMCAKLLIDAGANVDLACGPDKETALHVSCAQGNDKLTELLIRAGASLLLADHLGRCPLLMSCLCDQPSCAELLLAAHADCEQSMTKHNPGATPLYAAALSGSVRCVSILCEAGANVDAKTFNGATPLMVSCQQGHLQTSMILSSYGASRGKGHFQGCLPRTGSWAEDLAGRSGSAELIEWLHESSPEGFGALHHVEVLTVRRARTLLRSGRFSPFAGGNQSPVARARRLLREHRAAPAAALILRASAPWSPASHELWGTKQRALAIELLKIGHKLCPKWGRALLDVWISNVVPHILTWESSADESEVDAARGASCAASIEDAWHDFSARRGYEHLG